MTKRHETTVRRRWVVITQDTTTDMSFGRSVLPLTWVTEVTDLRGRLARKLMGLSPTEEAARRKHNAVIKHLKGGGTPSDFT